MRRLLTAIAVTGAGLAAVLSIAAPAAHTAAVPRGTVLCLDTSAAGQSAPEICLPKPIGS